MGPDTPPPASTGAPAPTGGGATTTATPTGDPESADADGGAGPASKGKGEGEMCGGFAGFVCQPQLRCVDDPSDTCDPKGGGADCAGICVPERCADPKRQYKSRDPDMCARMKFACEDGQQFFGDACGCGCVLP